MRHVRNLQSVHMNFDSSDVPLLEGRQHVQDGVETAAPGRYSETGPETVRQVQDGEIRVRYLGDAST